MLRALCIVTILCGVQTARSQLEETSVLIPPDTDSQLQSHYKYMEFIAPDAGGEKIPIQLAPATLDQIIPALTPAVHGFVKPCGTKFCLNGRYFYLSGTNHWNLHALVGYRGVTGSKAHIKKELETQASKGVNVIRVLCHSDGRGGWDERHLQPRLGVFDEEALKMLDYTVATAGENGIRLIMVLTNYEPFTGGIQQYVDWILGQGKDKELFYTDSKVKQAYKNWVKILVMRKNTVNGKLYKDDEAIFAFSTMNEPHTSNAYEKSRGLVPGRLVLNWLTEMVAFIRGLGVQQMIASGEEGYRADGEQYNWINNGFKGIDFTANLKSGVDFTTVHAYPDNWGFTPDTYKSRYGPAFIKDRANIAFAHNKPIIVEEYGLALGREGWKGVSRDSVMDYINNWAQDSGYAGSLVWEVRGGNARHYEGYVFSYGEDGTNAVLRQYAWVKEKDGGGASGVPHEGGRSPPPPPPASPPPPPVACTDVPPSKAYTCVQQAKWGKCNESWMKGYCLNSCNKCTTGGAPAPSPPPPPPPPVACTDVPPSKAYTCVQQAGWGKCGESWMKGYCKKSCNRCNTDGGGTCTDVSPDKRYTCQQQAGWGKCEESWMKSYCKKSCNKC